MSGPRSEPPSAPEQTGTLGAIANLGLRYPKPIVACGILVMMVCAAIAWDLPVSTSRYNLVSEDHPIQARQMRFIRRFGYPDSMVLVLTGGTVAERHRAVDRLSAKLEKEPELHNRVLARVGPKLVAEVLFLMQPAALDKLRTELGEDDLPTLLTGGLPAWIDAINTKISLTLDAPESENDEDDDDDDDDDRLDKDDKDEDERDERDERAEDAKDAKDKDAKDKDVQEPLAAENKEPKSPALTDQKTIDDTFTRLTSMLRALDKSITQGDAMSELPSMGEGATIPRSISIDEAGYVIGSDGGYHMIALFPDIPGDEASEVQPLVRTIRRIVSETQLSPVNAAVTGMPALGTDELQLVQRGLWQTSLSTSLAILLLLYAAFRSFRYTILALIPLGAGVLLTLAIIRPLYGGLNLITSCFISVLLALGIDFGVFLLSRYGEMVRAGATPEEAIRGALTKAGPGMLVGAVTTVMAFLMTTTTEFTAYRELGVITAIGLILMVTITFLMLPPLLWLAGRGATIRAPELPGVEHIPGLVRRAPGAIVVSALGLVALGGLAYGDLRFNPRHFDFLPEETESARALRRIEKDAAVSPIFAETMAESVSEARTLAEKLRKTRAVAAVQTATDLLPPLNAKLLAQLKQGVSGPTPDWNKLRKRTRHVDEVTENLRDLTDTLDELLFVLRQNQRDTKTVTKTRKAVAAVRKRIMSTKDAPQRLADLEQNIASLLERAWTTARAVADRGHYLPTDLPPVFRARFASNDGKALAVFASPAGDIWDEQTARTFNAEVEAVTSNVSGLAINVFEHMRMIREGFVRASLLSASLVLLVLLVGFRRLSDALIALFPCVIGVGWLFGLMGWLDIEFNVANIVVLPLILGIGVDAGAHMTHRWRQSMEEHGGVADLDEVVRGTGAAVILASLTTGVGFAALIMGDYGGMKSLGLTMSMGIGCCLLASVVVLPALLELLARRRA